MEFKGKIIEALPLREGDREHNGEKVHWVCQGYVAQETEGDYPKKMVFDIFGEDRIKRLNVIGLMSANTDVIIYFDIDARKGKNGGWFNSLRAYDVRLAVDNSPKTAEEANAQGMAQQDEEPF